MAQRGGAPKRRERSRSRENGKFHVEYPNIPIERYTTCVPKKLSLGINDLNQQAADFVNHVYRVFPLARQGVVTPGRPDWGPHPWLVHGERAMAGRGCEAHHINAVPENSWNAADGPF